MNENDKPKHVYTAEDEKTMKQIYNSTIEHAQTVVARFDLNKPHELMVALDFLRSEVGARGVL